MSASWLTWASAKSQPSNDLQRIIPKKKTHTKFKAGERRKRRKKEYANISNSRSVNTLKEKVMLAVAPLQGPSKEADGGETGRLCV